MLCEPEAALDTTPERHLHRRRCAMYYSSGNYEAFARPRKPERAERASAWIIGTGLAGLSAAVFLIRDGTLPEKNGYRSGGAVDNTPPQRMRL